jgi:TPR repeat protein
MVDKDIKAPDWGLMGHVVEATCAKCNYSRKAVDTAPAWQCPQCGVAYLKSQAAADESAQRRALRRATQAEAEEQPPVPERSARKWVAIVALVLVAAMVWQWQSRQSSAREKKAQQEAAARQQEIDAAKQSMQDDEKVQQTIAHAYNGNAGNSLAALNDYAAQGNTQAMVALGRLHQSGHGMPRNHEQAMVWFRKAAAEGSAVAMVNLGYVFEIGHGETRQPEQAANWYERAGRQGHASGLYSLASMLEKGEGLAPDPRKAYMLYELAGKAFTANPNADYGLLPSNRSGLGAVANQIRMRATMSPVDVVRATEQAEAWKVGQPFP